MRWILGMVVIIAVTGCQTTKPTVATSRLNEQELGSKAFENGDYPQAIEQYNRWLAKYPDSADVVFERGRVHNKLKQYDMALRDFDEALAKEPTSLRPQVYRCGVLLTLKRHKDARASLTKLMTDPGFSSLLPYEQFLAYTLDGRMKNMKGDYEGALTSLEKAMRLCEEHSGEFQGRATVQRIALYPRATAYQHLGNYKQAALDMEQYILLTQQAGEAVSPKDYKSLAIALYMSEELEKCKRILSQLSAEDRRELGTVLGDTEFFAQATVKIGHN